MSGTNPQIKQIEVGIRNTRKVYIYPLSMQDQFNLIDKIAEMVKSISELKEKINSNETAIDFIKNLITNNLEEILIYVTDESERPTTAEITNVQFYELVDTIFNVNFETAIKNFQNLFQRAKSVMSIEKTLTA